MKTLHPAKFSAPIMNELRPIVLRHAFGAGRKILVVDPFAGSGRIHDLAEPDLVETVGIEIEKPWADLHERTIWGDSRRLRSILAAEEYNYCDMIVTSPTYGNRFSDKHNARDGSRRRGYTHDLRAMTGVEDYALAPTNTGGHKWGSTEYKQIHMEVYAQCVGFLTRGGLFVVNVSDIVRNFQVHPVAQWHLDVLLELGLQAVTTIPVPTQRMRMGANSNLRVDNEMIYVLKKVS